MSDKEKLQEMVDSYPQTISDLEDSIASLDVLITDLQEQQAAIENEVLTPLTSASDAYLAQKADSFGPTHTACTSGGYGVSNITEWAIVDGTCFVDEVVFKSKDVSETVDPEQYQRQLDFASAYGHINDEVGTGGTYGIADNITNLQTGKSIQQANKNKYEEVLDIYSDFV